MSRRVIRGIAAGAGIVALLLTLCLDSRAIVSMGYSGLSVLSVIALPGVIGSMAIAGNNHDFSLWVAAFLNGLLYFGLCWTATTLFNSVVKRVRSL
jgi:hypothetical protein